MTKHTLLPFFALTLLAPYSLLAGAADPVPVVRYAVEGKYENVRDDLINAINSRGLVIDQNSHVGKMLDRTGKDLGATKKIFGDDQAQAFSFCSAVISRKTMEADPHNIVFCPYTILLYSTVAEPKKVYLSYRRPQSAGGSAASKAALKEVGTLLDGIARESLNLK
ncbi:MAG: hypothetical protein Q8L95_11750 [Burkholderiales bacterium]|nr:hypothetical protein [Burkholderiales bacterium]